MKKANIVFFIVAGFLTAVLSYGLSELYNENVYFFGYELTMIFIIILIVFFTREELSKVEFQNTDLRFKSIHAVFYRYFSVFYILVAFLTIIIILTNRESFSNGYLPFLLPVISVLLMVDIVISLYLRETSQENINSEYFNLNPNMIDVLFVPIFITSFIAILGEFLNVQIGVLLLLIFAATISLKLLIVKQFKRFT